ncbi:PREDICTED: major pollen allergen Bet v 1-D/H-like [Populus euphratica]|uniref:Major pollen allergen Bet v 1-D/H-like n=1 Tax=Populus euphratica TaxID=75702 RepID=A0AAJ6SY16_POPEU|nr:PREDICTED: major pollen allergen Bet v 1-D/H-like [Populus euphratica]
MVSGTILGEYTSAVSADRLWKASFCDGHNLIPKLLPGIISSIEILEGDGAGVGSVKKFNFTDVIKDYSYVKDRVEVMDLENHIVKYSTLEGGVMGIKVKSYTVEISLTATNKGGCLSKMKIEYESIGDSLLSEEDANDMQQGIFAMVKAIDAHLVENHTAYA